jgi:hypothetical protein
MSGKSFTKMVVVAVALICIFAGFAEADQRQLQQKLSRDIKIKLDDVTIVEALDKIGESVGVKIVLSSEAEWRLPYGENTRLSVILEGPLADGLTEMLNAFFMRYAVGAEVITVYPRPELDHVIGRPGMRQLELLRAVYTRPIRTYTVDRLQESITNALGQEVSIWPVAWHRNLNMVLRKLAGERTVKIEDKEGSRVIRTDYVDEIPGAVSGDKVTLPVAVSLAQILSDTVATSNEDWCIPVGGSLGTPLEIRIAEDDDIGALKRGQLIDVRYENESALDILYVLADIADIEFMVGKDFDFDGDQLSVSMQNVTIQVAMERIAQMADFLYEAENDEMIVLAHRKPAPPKKPIVTATRRPTVATPKTAARPGGEGYVGKISIPMDDGKYFIEFMLRENDLTEELRKLRAEKMAAILGGNDAN